MASKLAALNQMEINVCFCIRQSEIFWAANRIKLNAVIVGKYFKVLFKLKIILYINSF